MAVASVAQSGEPALAYVRLSTEMQHSEDDQERVCREAAAKRGLVLPDEYIFVDRETGQLASRPGWEAVKELIKSRKVKAVVGYSLSRMFRSLHEALVFWDLVRQHGVVLILAAENQDLRDDDRSEQFFQLRAMIDEWYARSLGNHVRTAQESLFLGNFVFGTITYGYKGVPVAGPPTKRGRARCQVAIDEEEARWVMTVFEWFGLGQRSVADIVRELNACGAPLRGNRRTRCWTYTIVRHMLSNSRYIGKWNYGSNKTVIVDHRYKRGVPREEPLRTLELEHLRIINDLLWAKVQERLGTYRGRAGRKPKDGNRKKRPRALNRLYTCEVHGVPMTATGTKGIYQACPVCQKEREPALLSLLHRERTQRMVCERLAGVIQDSRALATRVVAECQAQAVALQEPDTTQLDDLERARRKLDQQIGFVLSNSGDTDQDRAESARALQDARARRAAFDVKIATLKAAMNRPINVPTVEDVQIHMDNLAMILIRGASSEQPEDVAAVGDIVTVLTGAVILVSQAGERKRQRGWLRLTMRSNLLAYLLGHFGAEASNDGENNIIIDLRRQPKHERIADEVKELADQGVPMAVIAKEFEAGSYTITKALRFWHTSRDLQPPDYRAIRNRLKIVPVPPKYQQITEEAAKLIEQPLHIHEIAERVGANRDTTAKAINWWREQHGLSKVDFRHRRKELTRKRRQDEDGQDRDAGRSEAAT